MKQPKIILGIETSCDETSAAVVQKERDGVKILSNIVASSAALQAKYGGVIPEQAAREQLKAIIPVIQEALAQAFPSVIPAKAGVQKIWIPDQARDDRVAVPPIDATAVTQGPGLIGSLLVGVETAKVLAAVWEKPLVPVNHLLGHFYANWISQSHLPKFPCLGLLVSGGHTDLVLFKDHDKYEYLGGTRDDAAGEAFDKTARLLGLSYPGGPVISKFAERGNPKAFKLPRPMLDSGDFDFSFSGFKTAVANLTADLKNKSTDGKLSEAITQDLCASIEEAIIDILVKKTIAAAQKYKVEQIIIAGGVAANQKLARTLITTIRAKIPRARVFIPPPNLCTDNAAYIAAAAFFNYHPVDHLTLQANPNLSLS